jgi:RNA polymerase sigma factor (sigma-70 family)
MIEPTSLRAVPAAGTGLDFEEFFRAEYARLFQALLLLTGNAYEADDVTQEALIRAYERWDQVRTMDSPAGYVYRTALNLNRSRLRKLAVRARRVFAAPPIEDVSAAVAIKHDVRRELGALPDAQREALILIDWLGLGSDDAGRVLGIEASSVRGRLHRGRASLRQRLGDDDE